MGQSFEEALAEAIAFDEASIGGYDIPSPGGMGFKPDSVGGSVPVGGSDNIKEEKKVLNPFGKIVTTNIEEELSSIGGDRLVEAFIEGLDQRLLGSSVIDDVPWDNEDLDEADFTVPSPSKFGFKPEPLHHLEKSLTQKGYVDLERASSRTTLDDIANALADVMKNGVAFIRDSGGFLKERDPSLRNFRAIVAHAVADSFFSLLQPNVDYLNKIEKVNPFAHKLLYDLVMNAMQDGALRKARVQVKPVTGKTGAGYKVTISPTLEQFIERHKDALKKYKRVDKPGHRRVTEDVLPLFGPENNQ